METIQIKIHDISHVISLLIKKQFLSKNKLFFIVIPGFLAILLTIVLQMSVLFQDNVSDQILTIISVTGGVLLNFLALILSDEKSILYKKGSGIIYDKIIFKNKQDSAGEISELDITYFNYLYSKVFFIIFLTIIYIIYFVLLKLGLFNLIYDLLQNYFKDMRIVNFGIKLIYLFFIILYFMNVLYTLFITYFLLQRDK